MAHEAAFEPTCDKPSTRSPRRPTVLLAGALSDLLETAPPRLVGRLASTSRFADRP